MHKDSVEHFGTVESVTFNSIVVKVEESCECQGCAVAGLCSGKKAEEDTIVIPRPRDRQFSPGDRVALTATPGSKYKAMWWSMVLPTIIIVGVVLALMEYFPDLGFWTVIIAVLAVAGYDVILYLFRKDLAMSVHWQIRHC